MFSLGRETVINMYSLCRITGAALPCLNDIIILNTKATYMCLGQKTDSKITMATDHVSQVHCKSLHQLISPLCTIWAHSYDYLSGHKTWYFLAYRLWDVDDFSHHKILAFYTNTNKLSKLDIGSAKCSDVIRCNNKFLSRFNYFSF